MLLRIRRIFALLVMLFGIPALGWFASNVLATFRTPILLFDLLPLGDSSLAPALRWTAIVSAGIGASLIAVMWSAAAICGRNRAMLVAVFGSLVRLVSIVLVGLVAMQAVVAIYSLVVLEVGFLGAFSLGIVAAIAVGAAGAAYEIAKSSLRLNTPLLVTVVGSQVSRSDQPQLWQSVEKVAERLSARVPDNLILGLGPNFFATAALVQLSEAENPLSGETLFLSLPVMRTLSRNEFTAIVGHELGHFHGEDTAFTQRFVPIYRGLTQALAATHSQRKWHAFASRPAQAVLEASLSQFHRAERAISRDREFAADRSGAAAASSEAVIAALLRTTPSEAIWAWVTQQAIQFIREGKHMPNLSLVHAGKSSSVANELDPVAWLASVKDRRQPHPTDTHPTTAARAEALGVGISAHLLHFDVDADRAISLVKDLEGLEERLSETLRELLIAHGVAQPPRDQTRPTARDKQRAVLANRAAARKRDLDRERERERASASSTDHLEGQPPGG